MTDQITVPRKTWDATLEALEALLKRDKRNTCQHEETHRGGAIWEICKGCGAKWADDRGGKPKWKDPSEWSEADAVLTAANAVNELQQAPLGHDGKGCNEVLRMAGKVYPRTCKACGLGPCKWKSAANAMQQQAQGAVPWKCVDGSACKHGWWCSESYCQEHCVFRSTSTKGTPT